MRETKQKIAEYKKHIIGLKEKVIGTLILLVMSTIMLGTVSFAWLTLSRNPEVSGAATSVAANGNLEIALAPADGSEPRPSKVGDSLLTVFEKNTTWGNLVNLSIEEYGLDNLTLRPASLNTAELLTSPLYAAEYGEDGRVKGLVTSFAFATWQMEKDGVPAHFLKTNDKGVRAITSTTMKDYQGDKAFYEMTKDLASKNITAGNTYKTITTNKSYMNTLSTMMGLYMTARMNSSHDTLKNPECDPSDIQNFIAMYTDFLKAYDEEAEALAAIINLQNYIISGGTSTSVYTAQDVYDLYSKKENGTYDDTKFNKLQSDVNKYLTDNGKATINLEFITTFIQDRNTVSSDLDKLKEINESGTIKWKDSGLDSIVNNMVDVGKCLIGDTTVNAIIAGGATAALDYLSGTHNAIITNGILYNFEYLCGAHISVEGLSISVTVNRYGITVPGSVTANIYTNAPRDTYEYKKYEDSATNMKTGSIGSGTEVALDTYGLAIDFFVRTNAANSYLTLEGNILTEMVSERAIGTNAAGEEVELYTIVRDVEETTDEGTKTTSVKFDIYKVVTEDDSVEWYYLETHALVSEEELGDQEPKEKWVDVKYVVGYEGENRIWGEDSNLELSINSSSQGSGSCYVYYADSPEDQARSLNVLASMEVVFVDDKGAILATATLDTEHYYAESGKVIIPLVLKSDSLKIGEDAEGNGIYAITALEQNVATRITAIIYLDGTVLENDDVLASADIQGQLNIQFASSVPLYPLRNEDLQAKELHISASLDKTNFDYDDKTQHPMTTNLSVTIDGMNPSKVEAFFIRQINSTQGSREKLFTLQKDGNGKWIKDYTFTTPGIYVIKSVFVDSVEYELDEQLVVTIDGFALKSLSWGEGDGSSTTVMTADTTYSTKVYLQFQTNDASLMPKEVQGRFLRDDGLAVNVDFKKDSAGLWTGKSTFVTSGEYILQYLILDGNYTEIPETMQKNASMFLGLKVNVYTSSPHSFKYVPTEMTDDQKNLAMSVEILTDTNEILPGRIGAKLHYGLSGSTISAMDTDLTWDASSESYIGTMHTPHAGVFTFLKVTIGENVISKAGRSVVFTILSPDPPKYEANRTTQTQVAPENNATFRVALSNAVSAIIRPVVRNTQTGEVYGEEYYNSIANSNDFHQNTEIKKFAYAEKDDSTIDILDGFYNYIETNESTGGTTEFVFDIPIVKNSQGGMWQLIGLEVARVFDANGNEYTVDRPMYIDLTDEEVIEDKGMPITVVIKDFNISFPSVFGSQTMNSPIKFGITVDGNGNETVTGQFMEGHKLNSTNNIGLFFSNEFVPSESVSTYVNNVKVTFKYDSSKDSNGYIGMRKYGSYNTASDIALNVSNIPLEITVPLTDDNKDGLFTISSEVGTFIYAGEYKISSISYTIVSQNVAVATMPTGSPVITVASKAPSVVISAITPNGNHNADTGNEGSGHGSVTSSISSNKLEAYVHFKCDKTLWVHNYTQPTVTLQILDIGYGESAQLPFYTADGTAAATYSSSGSTTKTLYTWTQSQLTCKLFLGTRVGQSLRSDKKTAAGDISGNQLSVIYKNTTFMFTIPTIIIHNPY